MEMRLRRTLVSITVPILFGILLVGIGLTGFHSLPPAYASSTMRISTFTPDPSGLMSVIKSHMNSNDVTISFRAAVVNMYPVENRALLAQSFIAINQAVTTAN